MLHQSNSCGHLTSKIYRLTCDWRQGMDLLPFIWIYKMLKITSQHVSGGRVSICHPNSMCTWEEFILQLWPCLCIIQHYRNLRKNISTQQYNFYLGVNVLTMVPLLIYIFCCWMDPLLIYSTMELVLGQPPAKYIFNIILLMPPKLHGIKCIYAWFYFRYVTCKVLCFFTLQVMHQK